MLALVNEEVGEPGTERRLAQLLDRRGGLIVAGALRLDGELLATLDEVGWSNDVELIGGGVEIHF